MAGQRYEVHCSGAVAQRIYRAHASASPEEKARIAAAFEEIIERLEADPYEVGEPLYRLAALRMQVRTVVVRPVSIDFGICEDRPIVFIKTGTVLGG
jgi:hypothetical protein